METPLEALAFNYASFGIFTLVNNLWTWIAVVTAAVSVWRFKATVTYRHHSPPPVQEVLSSSSYENCKRLENDVKGRRHQMPSLHKVEDEKINAPSSSSRATSSSSSRRTTSTSTCPSFCENGLTRGRKFMACYHYEVQENDDVVVEKETFGEEDEENVDNVFDVSEKLRMKDMGLFDFQDLRMLNGNIVRLWDDYYACSNVHRRRFPGITSRSRSIDTSRHLRTGAPRSRTHQVH